MKRQEFQACFGLTASFEASTLLLKAGVGGLEKKKIDVDTHTHIHRKDNVLLEILIRMESVETKMETVSVARTTAAIVEKSKLKFSESFA